MSPKSLSVLVRTAFDSLKFKVMCCRWDYCATLCSKRCSSPSLVEFVCVVVSFCLLSTFYKLAATSAGDSHSFSLQMMVLLARYFSSHLRLVCACVICHSLSMFVVIWVKCDHVMCAWHMVIFVVVLVWSCTVQLLLNGHLSGEWILAGLPLNSLR